MSGRINIFVYKKLNTNIKIDGSVTKDLTQSKIYEA